MTLDGYKPKLVDGPRYGVAYAEVLIELRSCGSCKMPIYYPNNPMWPHYIRLNAEAQCKPIGWVPVSNPELRNSEDEVLCQPCADKGFTTFTCCICKQTKTSDHLHKRIGGYNYDDFCKECYETVPAKIWCEEVDRAFSEHRWDSD